MAIQKLNRERQCAGYSWNPHLIVRGIPADDTSEHDFRKRATGVADGENLPHKWTVLIAIYGMHQMDGSENSGIQMGRSQPFYKTLEHLASLVNSIPGPLIIGCVAATQSLQVALVDSPQSRVNLTVPRVTNVTRAGKHAFDVHGNRLLRLLVEDMGDMDGRWKPGKAPPRNGGWELRLPSS